MVEQRKIRFDRLRRFLFGIPWSEKTLSLKIRAVIVYSIFAFIFVTPFIMVLFGISPDEFEAAEPILLPIFGVFVGGGIVLAILASIWDWIKKKSRRD